MSKIIFDNLEEFKKYMLEVSFEKKDLKDFRDLNKFLKEHNLKLCNNLFKELNLKVWFNENLVYDITLEKIKLIKMVEFKDFEISILDDKKFSEYEKNILDDEIYKDFKKKYYFPIYKNFQCIDLDNLFDIYELYKEEPEIFQTKKIKIELEYKLIL